MGYLETIQAIDSLQWQMQLEEEHGDRSDENLAYISELGQYHDYLLDSIQADMQTHYMQLLMDPTIEYPF